MSGSMMRAWLVLLARMQTSSCIQQCAESGDGDMQCITFNETMGNALLQSKTSVTRATQKTSLDEERDGEEPVWQQVVVDLAATSEPEGEPEAEPEGEPEAEAEAEAEQVAEAQFLIQATFGPTHDELRALHGKRYVEWIQEQIAIPASSHRAYYRKRLNPRAQSTADKELGRRPHPCDVGSRWTNFVFKRFDHGSEVRVEDGRILVDGEFRSDIETESSLPSRWSELDGDLGFVCYIDESVGGDLYFYQQSNCRGRYTVRPNPAVFARDGAPNVPGLQFSMIKPGIVVVENTTDQCAGVLEGSKNVSIIESMGAQFIFDARIVLEENSPAGPLRGESHKCVPRNTLNEGDCRLPHEGTAPRTVSGLSVQMQMFTTGQHVTYLSAGDGEYIPSFLVADVNFNQVGILPSVEERFAAKLSSNILIERGGSYEFFLTSDAGSRLFVNGEQIVDNGGWHGMRERSGIVNLTTGSHPIIIDYFQGTGGKGLILKWKGPDSNDEKKVVPGMKMQTETLRLPGEEDACPITCGSPDEVASDPSFGHQFPMYVSSDVEDRAVDNKHRNMPSTLAKSAVWVEHALKAQDQLRQRVAWALSQIIVANPRGSGYDSFTEMHLSFYDIFVRNAFGSYRDILREVTFHPIMGAYLTHTGSTSYLYNGRYPNENFAREIMQLFSLGIWKLHPDGTLQRDSNGDPINAYTNDDILSFSRVLTGFEQQSRRGNVEPSRDNRIDPMRINPGRRDVFPKVDLNGAYLGDGVPLCDQQLPRHSFLSKGARFKITVAAPDAVELQPESALYQALCSAEPGSSTCSKRLTVELMETIECSGQECQMDQLTMVKVGSAYYWYVPPTCVHLFVDSPGGSGSLPERAEGGEWNGGFCVDKDGTDVNHQVARLADLKATTLEEQKVECLAKCRDSGAVGCEIHTRRGRCYAHFSSTVSTGNGRGGHVCAVFNLSAYETLDFTYSAMKPGAASCPDGAVIENIAECRAAATNLGYDLGDEWIGSSRSGPHGCYVSTSGRVHWNVYREGKSSSGVRPMCRQSFDFDSDGNMIPDGGSRIAVSWEDASPPPEGAYLVSSKLTKVFSELPSKPDALSQLFIGSHAPAHPCTVCDGEVQAYAVGDGAYNEHTVFKVDGKYFKNLRSVVHLKTSNRTFRNPPRYLTGNPLRDANPERASVAEIEALLDHLFHHENTPAFVSTRLIQRFTTSNPSPWYVRDVAEAFRTGTYNGTTFSGKYGDLGATLAAILMHPEARSTTNGNYTAVGSLREPMLKFVHFLRSMEYTDVDHDPVIFRKLQDIVGQFPYESPTVFNFYLADFELPSMNVPEPESEPEAEPESESEMEMEDRRPKANFAPELQILTPSYLVGYLNGMESMIHDGVSEDCSGGSGSGVGIETRQSSQGRWRDSCPQGEYGWQPREDPAATLRDLDLLLTGGRLTPLAREVVERSYLEAPESDRLQAAQTAIVMTPEFNTLGQPLPLDGLRNVTAADVKQTARSYKAIVVLFLYGGADTWNLFVPLNCDLYDEYSDIRTDLALTPGETLTISPRTEQPCDTFGVHSSHTFLQSLYTEGQAAFVSNVGNLVGPISKAEYRANSGFGRCRGGFSHSDQQVNAQTVKCQDSRAAMGGGGRIADAVGGGAQKFSTASFAIGDGARWADGSLIRREIVGSGSDDGPSNFKSFEQWKPAIINITMQRHGNVYSDVYAQAFQSAIATTEYMTKLFGSSKLQTDYSSSGGSVGRDLKQVAEIISTREGRQAERDFFFLGWGGWDHHRDMKRNLASKLTTVDQALEAFVLEMKAQDVWDDVAFTVLSEFGRTLDSNGGGSDHAWAGQSYVVGGSVHGGRVLNKYPSTLVQNGPFDLGRGRLIPEYPWESVLAPMAQWMGVADDQMASVFPNLGNFNADTHLINDLFRN